MEFDYEVKNKRFNKFIQCSLCKKFLLRRWILIKSSESWGSAESGFLKTRVMSQKNHHAIYAQIAYKEDNNNNRKLMTRGENYLARQGPKGKGNRDLRERNASRGARSGFRVRVSRFPILPFLPILALATQVTVKWTRTWRWNKMEQSFTKLHCDAQLACYSNVESTQPSIKFLLSEMMSLSDFRFLCE